MQEEKYPVWTFLTENFHLKIISPPSPLRIPLILSSPSPECLNGKLFPSPDESPHSCSCSFSCAAEPSESKGKSADLPWLHSVPKAPGAFPSHLPLLFLGWQKDNYKSKLAHSGVGSEQTEHVLSQVKHRTGDNSV